MSETAPRKRAPRKKVAVAAPTVEDVAEDVADTQPVPNIPAQQVDSSDGVQKLVLSKAVYDHANRLARLLLPALATLYATVGSLWHLPHVNEVVGTIIALNVALGAIVTVSSNRWNNSPAKFDGAVHIEDNGVGNGKTYSLVVHGDPEDIDKKDQIVFKVHKPT